jgi:murein DD-endopeptidase MepM/ murein hydrolase activator NlpD
VQTEITPSKAIPSTHTTRTPPTGEHATLTTRTLITAERTSTRQAVPSWVWPLPRVQNVSPSVQCRSGSLGSGIIEIGYPPDISVSTPIPILAARDGIVTYAACTAAGAALYLHHPDGWSTQYECLTSLAVMSTDRFRRSHRVHKGSVLGYLQHTPLHIRFSLSRLTEQGMRVLDPAPHVSQWQMLSWSPAMHGRKRPPG